MEPKQRKRGLSTRRYGRVPPTGTDVEFGEELGHDGTCTANDVSCWTNHTLLGGNKWVPRNARREEPGRASAGGRDMEIAGEIGRPGARQFTNAVEANANRTLVGDTKGLPGYGRRRGNRGSRDLATPGHQPEGAQGGAAVAVNMPKAPGAGRDEPYRGARGSLPVQLGRITETATPPPQPKRTASPRVGEK